MHRMCRLIAVTGFVLTTIGLATPRASAALLRPDAGRAYPDIAADINGKVDYTYNPETKTGVFHVKNTPYLIAGGSTQDKEYMVLPNGDTGIRSQEIRVVLDQDGKFVDDPSNNYELYGTINTDGQTFTGLLLKGVPTGFGSQDLDSVGVKGSDVFDVNLDITGGSLAKYFGDDAYMRITPELLSTFRGQFDENFTAVKATSNTRSYNSPLPFPIPEPTTLAVLLLGVGGLAFHGFTRRAAARR
jgi:hypothetical protein